MRATAIAAVVMGVVVGAIVLGWTFAYFRRRINR
jgi:hypothetical protein